MSQDPKSKLSSLGLDFVPVSHNDTYDFIKPEQFDLNGRSVLITGASKGIGKAIVMSYAKAGASHIAIGARSDLKAIETAAIEAAKKAGRPAPQVLSIKLDVADEQSVDAAAATIKKEFGSLDIIVNNAGYLNDFGMMTEQKPNDWWKTWEVNMKGPFLIARAMIPLLNERKDGLKTILGVSSIGANAIFPGLAGYQVSKLAAIRFAEFLVAENEGLLSFSVHPGAIQTELSSQMTKELYDSLSDTPELAGDSMVWLTAERRDWLAGRYVMCQWGMDELLKKKSKIVEEDLLKVRTDFGREM